MAVVCLPHIKALVQGTHMIIAPSKHFLNNILRGKILINDTYP
jgi:hypothetical protein